MIRISLTMYYTLCKIICVYIYIIVDVLYLEDTKFCICI